MPQRDVNVQIVKIVSYIFYSVFYKRGILKRDIIISQSYLKYLTYFIGYLIGYFKNIENESSTKFRELVYYFDSINLSSIFQHELI